MNAGFAAKPAGATVFACCPERSVTVMPRSATASSCTPPDSSSRRKSENAMSGMERPPVPRNSAIAMTTNTAAARMPTRTGLRVSQRRGDTVTPSQPDLSPLARRPSTGSGRPE